jgi:hypothetical protein
MVMREGIDTGGRNREGDDRLLNVSDVDSPQPNEADDPTNGDINGRIAETLGTAPRNTAEEPPDWSDDYIELFDSGKKLRRLQGQRRNVVKNHV